MKCAACGYNPWRDSADAVGSPHRFVDEPVEFGKIEVKPADGIGFCGGEGVVLYVCPCCKTVRAGEWA